MIDVALLGTGGTLPLPGRFLSSVLVRYGGKLILCDCGEGTQVSLRGLAWGLREIGTILISHFHADHISGLPGLLLTIGNSERGPDEPLTIVGPKGLTRIVDGLRVIAPHLPYPVRILEWTGRADDSLFIGDLKIRCTPADHEIACLAWRMDLPRKAEFLPQKARELAIPLEMWKLLQRGETVQVDGKAVLPSAVMGPPRPGVSFGFVTDSRPTQNIAEFMSDVDLLICEGTYGDPDDRHKAIANKHMTFGESSTLAAAARAKRLWLTHFSPSMPNPDYFRREAEKAYPNVVIGSEYLNETLRFVDV